MDADGKPMVVYHGTNVGINEFKPAKGLRSAGGLFESSATSPFKFFSPDKDEAQSYANAKGGHLLFSVYLRMERPLDATTPDGLARMHRLFGSLDDTELSDWADSAVDLLDGIDELRATTPAEKSYFIKRDAKGRVIGQRATEREGYILEKYTAEDHAAEIERDLAQLIAEYEALLSAVPSSDAPLSVWAALDEPDSGDRLRAAGFDGLVFHENDGKKTFAVLDSTQIKSATGNNGDFDPANPDIRRSADGSIQGFFDPQTGQSFLIADNLTAEAAPGVLMHEVGIHMAADGSMKALFNRAAMMLKLQRGNPFMKAVQDRMDAAGETSGEEAAAYIAEAYENDRANAPASVQRWLADLLAAVKAWMFKKGIMGADRLTVADIAAVARANARSMARDGGATGGQGFGTAFSRAPAGDQTQTDAFKRWFAGSRVVDADGKPMVVYHGTFSGEAITAFDLEKGNGMVWTTSQPSYASEFTGRASGAVYPLYASIKKPFDASKFTGEKSIKYWKQKLQAAGVDASKIDWSIVDFAPEYGSKYNFYDLFPHAGNNEAKSGALEAIQAAGFDGLIAPAEEGMSKKGGFNYVAFSPTQIKSATGNSGAFDPANPDIRFS
ncbi:MAG TPA: hypothetical protein PLY99_16735, partial [Acidovorax temperans]|nr:hypothetical protein [Acidovorax temperans]